MLIACQECSATISETAAACPKCGAPPRVFLGSSVTCAECGSPFQTAWSSCRNCGAPRNVATSVASPPAQQSATAPQPAAAPDPANEVRTSQHLADDTTDLDVFLRTTGRINRQTFLVSFVVVLGLLILAFVALSYIDALPTDRLARVGIVAAVMSLLLPATIERLHDIGWSGWLAPIIFLPGGLLLFVLLAIFPGMKGQNSYGPPPARSW